MKKTLALLVALLGTHAYAVVGFPQIQLSDGRLLKQVTIERCDETTYTLFGKAQGKDITIPLSAVSLGIRRILAKELQFELPLAPKQEATPTAGEPKPLIGAPRVSYLSTEKPKNSVRFTKDVLEETLRKNAAARASLIQGALRNYYAAHLSDGDRRLLSVDAIEVSATTAADDNFATIVIAKTTVSSLIRMEAKIDQFVAITEEKAEGPKLRSFSKK